MLRAISGMFLLLVMQKLMGDTQLASRWDQLPDLLTDLILDGLDRGELL